MDKKCCSFDVTELENGYRIEVTGDDIKEKWKTIFEKCCTDEKIKNCFSACCGKKQQRVGIDKIDGGAAVFL